MATNGERLMKIETSLDYIQGDMKEIKSFIKKADNKYACKETEIKVENMNKLLIKYSAIAGTVLIAVELFLNYLL